MIPERYRRLDALFRGAIGVPESERRTWIEEHCEAELRRELEVLLDHDRAPRLSIEDSPTLRMAEQADRLEALDASSEAPIELEGYRFQRPIGAGGMGVVWEAEQLHPQRPVAIKVLRSGRSSTALLRRFATEVRALARMDHPGIARIHDAGVVEVRGEPRPYLVMELVRGEPILAWAERMGLALRGRCELFARVADATQGAHEKGVIHRDLKPANVLVDSSGQPKVLDFGVARLLGGESAGALGTRATNTGQLVGSLDAMSPEQASGRPDAIDVRTDVYSLGCLLFQLLTGRPPLRFAGVPLPEAVRRIHEEEPPRLATLDRRLAGDLETIAAKALAKAPRERYATASELAADVRRFLEERPIQARPATALYHLRKFARRNRAQAVGATIALVALAVAFVAVVVFARREHAARQGAERVAAELRRQLLVESLAGIRRVLDGDNPAPAHAWLARLPGEGRGWERDWLEARAASTLTQDHPLGSQTLALVRAGPEHVVTGNRGAALHRIRTTSDEPPQVLQARGQVRALAASADGRVLATVSLAPPEIAVYVGDEPVRLEPFVPGAVEASVAISPSGGWVAFGLPAGRIALWDLPSGETRVERALPDGAPRALCVDPGQGRLAFVESGPRPSIGLLDPASGEVVARLEAAGFAPELLRIPAPGVVAAIGGAELRVWRGESDPAPLALVGEADWSVLEPVPAASQLVLGDVEGRLVQVDFRTGELVHRGQASYGRPSALCSLPDERLLAVGYESGRVEFLDLVSGRSALSLAPIGNAPVYAMVAAPERDAVAVAQTSALRLVPVPKAAFRELSHESFVYEAVALPARGLWASTGWDGRVRLWDAQGGAPRGEVELGERGVGLCADDAGTALFVTTMDLWVRCLEIGEPVGDGAVDAFVRWQVGSCHAEPSGVPMVLSPSGRLVLRGCDRNLVALRVDDGGEQAWAAFPTAVRDLAVHPRTLALGALTQGHLAELDPDSLEVLSQVELPGMATALAPDPTDGWLVGLRDGRLLHLVRGEIEPRLIGELGSEVMALALSPDRTRLATGTRAGSVRLWDTTEWFSVLELDPHLPGPRQASYFYVHDLDWSPDGVHLISCSGDGTARMWDSLRR